MNILKEFLKKDGEAVFEQLLHNFSKLKANIKFIKTYKREYLVPTFATVKLTTKNGNKNLKLRLLPVIMEAELQEEKTPRQE